MVVLLFVILIILEDISADEHPSCNSSGTRVMVLSHMCRVQHHRA